jgi:hypothetical protein
MSVSHMLDVTIGFLSYLNTIRLNVGTGIHGCGIT